MITDCDCIWYNALQTYIQTFLGVKERMLAELWMIKVTQGNVMTGVQTAWQVRETCK